MKRIFLTALTTSMLALGGFGVSYGHDGHDRYEGRDRYEGHDPGRATASDHDRGAAHAAYDHRADAGWGFGIDRSGFGFGFQRDGFSFQFGRGFDHADPRSAGHDDFRGSAVAPHVRRDAYAPGWRW
jgi:hypothetical protein